MIEAIARAIVILATTATMVEGITVGEGVTAQPPSPTRAPAEVLTGVATWYDWHQGQAAAGPGLRAFLGPRWRGKVVRVCATGRCVTATLTDWCLCSRGNRIIDLDRRLFAQLAPTSRGVIEVSVEEHP